MARRGRRLPTLPTGSPEYPWQRAIQAAPDQDDFNCLRILSTDGQELRGWARLSLEPVTVMVLGHPWPRWRDVLCGDPCAYCGLRPAGTVDHIQPLIRGEGSSILLNGTGACARCNHEKADRPLLAWMATSERLRRRRAARRR
jgi:hypothetical protein